jgi:hypothetical protein
MATTNTSTVMLTSSTRLAFEHSREVPSSVYHGHILHSERKNEKYSYQEEKKKYRHVEKTETE